MLLYFLLFISIPIFFLLTLRLYRYLNRNSNYWKLKDVPFIPPIPILGNLLSLVLLRRSPGEFTGDLHNAPQGTDQRFLGFFLFNNEPALLIRDPELAKRILVQDFQHFTARNAQCNEKFDPVGANNLFVLRGPKWKYLRAQVSPSFTSAKFKQMFDFVKDSANELMKYIEGKSKENKEKSSAILDAKSTISRYTIDVISLGVFGLKANAILNAKSQFYYFGDKIFHMTLKRSFEVRAFVFMHWVAKKLNFSFFQNESTNFFKGVFREALQEREANNINRNDFIDALIKLKNEEKHVAVSEPEGEETFELKGDLLLAQPILFFTAGFETTATTISMALYELALQADIQERLRKDIVDCIKETGGEIKYETIMETKYLDIVVLETLRKYPPRPFLDRVCTLDYQIPDSNVTISKGTPVFISLYKGLHYDQRFFSDPEKFDPERFNGENKNSFHPFAYLPFGEGPHVCLARRFGFLNIKTALCHILTKFRIEVCEKTEIPLQIDNRAFILAAKNGNYIKFVKIWDGIQEKHSS